jgi:hypothetical protein
MSDPGADADQAGEHDDDDPEAAAAATAGFRGFWIFSTGCLQADLLRPERRSGRAGYSSTGDARAATRMRAAGWERDRAIHHCPL